MKNILHIILLSSFLMNCQTQKTENLAGEFYMINKSGFSEFSITNDSIFNRKLFPNFTYKRSKRRGNYYEKQIHVNHKVLFLIQSDKKDESYTSLMTYAPHKNKKHIKWVINTIDTTANLETIIRITKNDKRPHVGFNLYSKEQIDSLKLMKPIDDMTLNEFKGFQIALFEKMKVAFPEFLKSSLNGVYGMSSSFNFQMVLQTLLEQGFSPVQTSTSSETLYKKYFDDPEIKELMEQLKKQK